MKGYKYRKPRVYQTKGGRYYILSPLGKRVYVKQSLLSPTSSSTSKNINKINVVVKNLLYKRRRRSPIKRKALIAKALKDYSQEFKTAVSPTSPASNQISSGELERLRSKLTELDKTTSSSDATKAAEIKELKDLIEKQKKAQLQLADEANNVKLDLVTQQKQNEEKYKTLVTSLAKQLNLKDEDISRVSKALSDTIIEQRQQTAALLKKLDEQNLSDAEVKRQLALAEKTLEDNNKENRKLFAQLQKKILLLERQKKEIQTRSKTKDLSDEDKELVQLVDDEIKKDEKVLDDLDQSAKAYTTMASQEKRKQTMIEKKKRREERIKKAQETKARKKLEYAEPEPELKPEKKDEDEDEEPPALQEEEDEGTIGKGFGRGTYDSELNDVATRFKIPHYKGTVASDEIFDVISKKIHPGEKQICFIYNTDVASGPGIHWVAIRIDDQTIEIMNSLGEHATPQVKEQLAKLFKKINPKVYPLLKENGMIWQNASSRCGIHSLLFLIDRAEGKSFSDATGFVKKSIISKKERRARKFEELYL